MQPLFCLRGLRWCSCHVCLVAVSCSERAWGWVWLGRGWTGISFFLFLMWLNNPSTFLSLMSFSFLPITLLFYPALIWLHYLHLLTCPPLFLLLSPSLPVCLPQLSSSVRPHTTGFLFAVSIETYVCVCVWISSVCAQWSCTRRRVWSYLCICQGFVGAARRCTGSQGLSDEGGNAIWESEKRLGKEENPVWGEMWETRFDTEMLKWTEVSWVIKGKIKMKLSSLWRCTVVAGSSSNWFFSMETTETIIKWLK